MYQRMKKVVYLKETIWFLYADEFVAYHNSSQEKKRWKNPLGTKQDPELIPVQSWIGLPIDRKFQFITCPKHDAEHNA